VHEILRASAAAIAVASMALVPARASAQAAADFASPGRYELKLDNVRDGVVYVPRNYKADTPTPLLVWLHGAGGQGNVSTNLAELADMFTVIVLAPDSREWTWGAILGRWEPDVEFLQLALKQTIGRYSIDRTRLWLGGFSDGGSYALSLGISYGDVFRKVFAGAPGIMQPIEANGKPPIFLAHGRQDRTMPIDETSRKFRTRLEALGYHVVYREHDGGHQLPPEVLREVFEWLGSEAPAQADE
jgi:phospholipase/carboxylesterase